MQLKSHLLGRDIAVQASLCTASGPLTLDILHQEISQRSVNHTSPSRSPCVQNIGEVAEEQWGLSICPQANKASLV